MLKKITFPVLLIIITVLCLELLASFFYNLDFNQLKTNYKNYLKNNHIDDTNKEQIHQFDTNWAHINPHPYIGYTYTPKSQNKAYKGNNHGYNTPQSFPYKKKNNEYVIAIFGGSFAEQFSGRAKSVFISELKKIKKLKNTKITIINYAIGASKQPQSYISSSIYAKDFDIAIVIDGFNEITDRNKHTTNAYKPNSKTRFIMPHFYEPLFRLSKFEILSLGQKAFTRQILVNLSEFITTNYLLKKSSVAKIAFISVKKGFDSYTKKSIYKEKPTVNSAKVNNSIERRVEIWDHFTRLQHITINSFDKKIFTFIQPNHHFNQTKLIHKNESVSSSLAKTINKAYPMLINRLTSLNQQGFNVFSLTHVFKNNSDYLFKDSCHLTNNGYELIAKIIVNKISNSL